MYSVILCGGSGTRLWPLSRKNFPKQFLKLYSDKSLLQETFLRMKEIIPAEKVYFVTNKDNFFNVINQIKEVASDFDEARVLVEPESLNTAPAIAYALKYLAENEKANIDESVVILPSDHYVGKKENFLKLMKMAENLVGENVGTIGVTPLKPETGYGYIKKGNKSGDFFQVAEFKEKPDKKTAEEYLASGDYVWNSGIYIFSIRTFVHELKEHAVEIFDLMKKDFPVFMESFSQLPSISIDYAISEKSKKVIVFEGDFGWSDIGSFDSLAEIQEQNKAINKKHISIDSENIFAHSASGKLIATSGVKDLIVIENNDSILIQKKGESENVKKVVEYLKEQKMNEIEHNVIVHRPWGKYEVLVEGSTHKVKRITVYPGAKLSLQSHYHRAEHWVVVRGLAKIVNGDKIIHLRENESTFIPATTKHRLENPGKMNLELIEVQTGNYMEEDDILRFDDVYNREK